jgi:hypothetical protein
MGGVNHPPPTTVDHTPESLTCLRRFGDKSADAGIDREKLTESLLIRRMNVLDPGEHGSAAASVSG